ncbi:30S ribosomal protein S8 [Myxococcota bacterium]|nr:30S ribosomal protein S8 [Myxococcota bacterium]MCZ7619513.1 30S ribosomal protein S8 [Myxococcota bacterium]
MMNDPIGDMLARIRNSALARHSSVSLPHSKLKRAVAQVLAEGGFLEDVRDDERDGFPVLVLGLRYGSDGRGLIDGLRRVSKPSRRVYVGKDEIPRVRNGLGIAVLSTSKGVLSDRAAREAEVGGEILCEVW